MSAASGVRWVCTVGFLGAAFRHASDLLSVGWLQSIYMTLPINLFWLSLTLCDPLAAVLLWRRLRRCVALPLTNMLVEGGINTFVKAYLDQ